MRETSGRDPFIQSNTRKTMSNQEAAYSEIERLVKSFKSMPAAQRKGLNEMQTRLGISCLCSKRLAGTQATSMKSVPKKKYRVDGWIFPFASGMCRASSSKLKK